MAAQDRPGRSELDFVPIIDGLKKISYKGRTEVFMHPVARGVPILPAASEVTAETNRAGGYLEACLGTPLCGNSLGTPLCGKPVAKVV